MIVLLTLYVSLSPLVLSISACQKRDISSEAPARQQAIAVAEPSAIWLGNRAIPLVPDVAVIEKESLPPVESAASPVTPPVAHWQVNQGESVAATLRRWAAAADYTPLPNFSAKEEWSFIVTQDFAGDFEAALVWLAEGFQSQPVRPVVVLYANRTLDLIGQAGQSKGDPQVGASW
jgi:hypothetical protein